VVAAVDEGDSDADVDALLSGTRPETTSQQARETIIETLREAGGGMESDQLDAEVAAACGLTAKTIRNLRGDLSGKGLLKSIPDKDEEGTIVRWNVALTNPVPDPLARARGCNSRALDYLSQIRAPQPDCPPPREAGMWTLATSRPSSPRSPN